MKNLFPGNRFFLPRAPGGRPGIVLFSRTSFRRNLRGLKFPSRETGEKLDAFRKKAMSYLGGLGVFGKGVRLKFEDLDAGGRFLLAESQVIDHSAAKLEKAGLILSADGKKTVLLNGEDHFLISVLENGGDQEIAFSAASGLEELLGEKFDYAYSGEFGFLTVSPLNSGCALELSSTLHLPGLRISGALEKSFGNLYGMNFTVSGMYGEGSFAVGDLYRVSGKNSYGKSEEGFLEFFKMSVKNLVKEEALARAVLFRRERARTEDMVWRAYGILHNARLLSYVELAQNVSLLRMGMEREAIPGLGKFDPDRLFFVCQKNHLQSAGRRHSLPGCAQRASPGCAQRASRHLGPQWGCSVRGMKEGELEAKRADLARDAVK